MAEKTEKKEGGLAETLRTIVYAVLIALVVRTFAFEPFNIPSGSMIPTLLVGDYLFVSKYSYGYSRYSFPFGLKLFSGRVLEDGVERGDIVVFKKPTDNATDYIKRIVGLPGDRLLVRGGVLYVNDQEVKRELIGTWVDEGGYGSPAQLLRETLPGGKTYAVLDFGPNQRLDDTLEYVVPPGHYFGMGDNRDNSTDSRVLDEVGYIPAENLVGRAEFLFFSTTGDAAWWEVWRWPFTIRWSRLFQGLR
ncbi:MAG: signal peptidase I [Alphaproteobacteria bacterium]|nr:signal peptidase I [Alphaproteobacteria bacterium]